MSMGMGAMNMGMGNMGSMRMNNGNMGMGNMGANKMGMGNVKPWSLFKNSMNQKCECSREKNAPPNHFLVDTFATHQDCMDALNNKCSGGQGVKD